MSHMTFTNKVMNLCQWTPDEPLLGVILEQGASPTWHKGAMHKKRVPKRLPWGTISEKGSFLQKGSCFYLDNPNELNRKCSPILIKDGGNSQIVTTIVHELARKITILNWTVFPGLSW